MAEENIAVVPVRAEHFDKRRVVPAAEERTDKRGGENVALTGVADALFHGAAGSVERHMAKSRCFPGGKEVDREGIKPFAVVPVLHAERDACDLVVKLIGDTVVIESFGVGLLQVGNAGIGDLFRVFRDLCGGIGDNVDADVALKLVIRHSEIAHSGKGFADYSDSCFRKRVCRGISPCAVGNAAADVGFYVMTGEDSEFLAVADKQIAHILNSVDAVVVVDALGRAFRTEFKIRGGIEDNYRQAALFERLFRLERRRICKVKRDKHLGSALLEALYSLTELVLKPAYRACHYVKSV